MAALRILAQAIAHQAVEAVETFTHIDGIHADEDFGGGTEAEHPTRPRRPESGAPGRHRGSSTRSRCGGRCAVRARTWSLPLAAVRFSPRRIPLAAGHSGGDSSLALCR